MFTKHWRKQDKKDLKRAKTIRGLQAIALRILERLEKSSDKPIGMVCGPLSTGGAASRDANTSRLQKHIDDLMRQGEPIFDQLCFEKVLCRLLKKSGNTHRNLLEEFHLPNFTSGKIKVLYFVEGWETSSGARWKHAKALEYGIRIAYIS